MFVGMLGTSLGPLGFCYGHAIGRAVYPEPAELSHPFSTYLQGSAKSNRGESAV
jgi:hypothetical protein